MAWRAGAGERILRAARVAAMKGIMRAAIHGRSASRELPRRARSATNQRAPSEIIER